MYVSVSVTLIRGIYVCINKIIKFSKSTMLHGPHLAGTTNQQCHFPLYRD